MYKGLKEEEWCACSLTVFSFAELPRLRRGALKHCTAENMGKESTSHEGGGLHCMHTLYYISICIHCFLLLVVYQWSRPHKALAVSR